MKDKDFYGSGQHPEAGSPMVKINGQWYSQVDIDYLKSQSPKSLDRINSNTVSSAGFSSPKKIEETKSPREEQLERLVLMKNEETRLVKQLERTRGVIQHIKDWLQDN